MRRSLRICVSRLTTPVIAISLLDRTMEEVPHDDIIDLEFNSISSPQDPNVNDEDAEGSTNVNDDALIRKRSGRPPSPVWELFTDDKNPQASRTATCKHCKQSVFHYKKSESAKRHLNSCNAFLRYIKLMDPSQRPNWYAFKKAKTTVSVFLEPKEHH